MCQFSHFYLLSSGVKYVCIVAAISRTFSSYNAKVLYPESNYDPPLGPSSYSGHSWMVQLLPLQLAVQ